MNKNKARRVIYYNTNMIAVKKMKKAVGLFFICVIFIFCGCSKSASGSVAELTGRSWIAKLDGGGEARLSFNGERAKLTMSNGGEQEIIEGEFIADESEFVIFDKPICRNYSFTYVPYGDRLELSFEGNMIEMAAESR